MFDLKRAIQHVRIIREAFYTGILKFHKSPKRNKKVKVSEIILLKYFKKLATRIFVILTCFLLTTNKQKNSPPGLSSVNENGES